MSTNYRQVRNILNSPSESQGMELALARGKQLACAKPSASGRLLHRSIVCTGRLGGECGAVVVSSDSWA